MDGRRESAEKGAFPMERQITGKALLRHLSHIAIVIFEAEQFGGSHITATVHFVGSQAAYDVESYREQPGIPYEGMPKAEFLEKFRALHVEEWQQQYYNRNAQDGEAWMLKIHFADGCGPLVIDGWRQIAAPKHQSTTASKPAVPRAPSMLYTLFLCSCCCIVLYCIVLYMYMCRRYITLP